MELNEYQLKASHTSRQGPDHPNRTIIPLLGLASEAGELLNEYKKRLRDGDAHTRFEERLVEELGDLLWYLAEVATASGVALEEIATANLRKTHDRFGSREGGLALGPPRHFDAGFPEDERLPRQFVADFRQRGDGAAATVDVLVNGRPLGEPLTDNAHADDGYRFHDIFHLACVAVLAWSPVTRRNLKLKRRSDTRIDEVEDGGRAIVTEEGVSALVFAHATAANRFDGIEMVSYELLKAIRVMTAGFEVAACAAGEWEAAILTAYAVWREAQKHRGGRIIGDAEERTLRFAGPIEQR